MLPSNESAASPQLAARLAVLEARVVRQQRWFGGTLAAIAIWVLTGNAAVRQVNASPQNPPAPPNSMPADSVLRVRGLIVLDSAGVERVRIGAPLPDPPLFGKRISRGGDYAGIILMDATGTERSGYATTDEGQVMITLDESGRMVMNFMAQPSGGVRLNLTDEYDNVLRLGSSRDGPFLQMVRGGQPVLTLPDTSGGRR